MFLYDNIKSFINEKNIFVLQLNYLAHKIDIYLTLNLDLKFIAFDRPPQGQSNNT